ncbi:hypothetical protein [Vibrio parahaemolyticus]|uniref:hypothetical protein n=1 Tax=Vibrio parahaemolyticus TaxID=670 RepID=UPI000D732363|nr:hypothetical protein [Vibrio parahaemolyticus]PXB17818.1 hypothetical protein CXR47_07510 [Vibrio parahaemolyticus]
MNILFEQPEIDAFYNTYYEMLMDESDRGCILLGVSILDEQLDLLFRKILPDGTSKTKEKQIFDNKGAFGNIASKLDIAYVCRLLPLHIVESIKELRKARNNLAHKTSPFVLRENAEIMYNVLKRLEGKGCALSCLTNISGEVIFEGFVRELLNTEHPVPNFEGEKLFKTVEEIIEHIQSNPSIADSIMERRVRVLFVLSILLLNAFLVFYRNRALERLASE